MERLTKYEVVGRHVHAVQTGDVDQMTDYPLTECLACPDFVDNAKDDLDEFYKRTKL